MQSKNNLLVTVLVVVGIFFIFLAISFSTNVKKMEVDFNRQKALLAKENSDLKIKVEAIQNIVEEKIRAMDAVEKEKKTLERKFITLKNKNEELTSSLGKQLEELKRKNLTLKKRISNLENGDLIQKIREAIEKENNENIKIVLKNMLDKIEILKGNPSAAPSPVTPEKEKESFRDMAAESGITQNVPSKQAPEEKNGVVLSLDRKNNLIVISLGHKDGVKEGDRCAVLKGESQIGRARIMAARYRIAAAFIDDIQYKNSIKDIKEGDRVVMIEE